LLSILRRRCYAADAATPFSMPAAAVSIFADAACYQLSYHASYYALLLIFVDFHAILPPLTLHEGAYAACYAACYYISHSAYACHHAADKAMPSFA